MSDAAEGALTLLRNFVARPDTDGQVLLYDKESATALLGYIDHMRSVAGAVSHDNLDFASIAKDAKRGQPAERDPRRDDIHLEKQMNDLG